jgi:uncharacterized protein (TIGR03435 family)
MTRFLPLIALLALQAHAQTDPKPAFEVASIRANHMADKGGEGSRRESIEPGPANVTMRNVSLQGCIRWAYNVQPYQVNGPAWLESERFDIAAKAGAPAPEAQLRLMLQTLLADRFKLVLHRQSKEMSVYALLVGKGGHKLKESQSEGPSNLSPNKMLMVGERVPMSQLAELLSGPLRMPVVDMTELKGRYDFSMDPSKFLPTEMTPEKKMSMQDEVPNIFRAMLQEQLGLKLESRKAPIDILIVDSMEKTPTEN